MAEQTYLERLIEISAQRTSLRSGSIFTRFQNKIYLTDKRGALLPGISWERIPLIESFCFCRGTTINEDGSTGYKYFALNGVPLEFLTGSQPLIDNMWIVQDFDGVMFLARIEFSSENARTCLTVTHEKRIDGYGYLGYNAVIVKEGSAWIKYDFYDDYILDKRFDGTEIINNYSLSDMIQGGYYPQFVRDICAARGERVQLTMADFMKVKKMRSDQYIDIIKFLQSNSASIEMLSIKTKLPMELVFLIKNIIRDKPFKDFD